jgi:hypothetical protein
MEALEPEDEEGYGYDVQFLMHGEGMNVEQVRADIDAMGWSTLVVGNDRLIKVHVHVHDPGEPFSYAIRTGASLDDVVVENMQEQYQHYVEDRLARQFGGADDPQEHEVAVIAVASGEALTRLFKQDLGAARMIAGGQTMNPSTEDFLAAIDSLPNSKIVLLPNNKNVILAANQAASLARDKDVRVVATRTLPQGISAMLALANASQSDDLDAAVKAMEAGRQHVTSGEITTAIRDADINDLKISAGQYIGLLDGDLVVVGDDLTGVLRDLLAQATHDDSELITLYYGDSLDEERTLAMVAALADQFEDHEIEVLQGGQPLYPLIISVE